MTRRLSQHFWSRKHFEIKTLVTTTDEENTLSAIRAITKKKFSHQTEAIFNKVRKKNCKTRNKKNLNHNTVETPTDKQMNTLVQGKKHYRRRTRREKKGKRRNTTHQNNTEP